MRKVFPRVRRDTLSDLPPSFPVGRIMRNYRIKYPEDSEGKH